MTKEAFEKDRQEGYRPCVAFCLIHKQHLFLGKNRWSWQIPQGGIEPGESIQEALRREVSEELGQEWISELGEPTPIHTATIDMRIKKDGKKWNGKKYYYIAVPVEQLPQTVERKEKQKKHRDLMLFSGMKDFPGGLALTSGKRAKRMLRRQRGQKGRILQSVIDRLESAGTIK